MGQIFLSFCFFFFLLVNISLSFRQKIYLRNAETCNSESCNNIPSKFAKVVASHPPNYREKGLDAQE